MNHTVFLLTDWETSELFDDSFWPKAVVVAATFGDADVIGSNASWIWANPATYRGAIYCRKILGQIFFAFDPY